MAQKKIQQNQLDPSISFSDPNAVTGPASSTDNAIARFDGTTGKLVQDSGVTIDDTGAMNINGLEVFKNISNGQFRHGIWPALDNEAVEFGAYGVGYGTSASIKLGDSAFATGSVNIDMYARNDIKLSSDDDITVDAGNNLKLYGTTTINDIPVVTTTDAQTLTNKRITPRAGGHGGVSFTPNCDSLDFATFMSVAGNMTFGVPSGTPTAGQKFLYMIRDNGVARTITWNAIYRAIGVTLPTTTVVSKILYVGMVYNSTDTKWDVIAVNLES